MSRPAHRRSAAPSRRHPRRRRDRRPHPAHAAPGRTRRDSWAPRTRTATRLPRPPGCAEARASRLRVSCRNVRRPRPSRRAPRRGGGRRAACEHDHNQSRNADEDAAADVERMVHAAIHARRGDKPDDRHGDRPREPAEEAVRESRRQQQDEPAVDSDRRSRVAGRIAGVDRKVVEANDARPMRVDDEASSRDTSPTRPRARTRRTRPAATSAKQRTRARSPRREPGAPGPRRSSSRPSDASVRDDVRCAASHTSTRSSADPMPQECSSTCVTRNPSPIESAAISANPSSIATVKPTTGCKPPNEAASRCAGPPVFGWRTGSFHSSVDRMLRSADVVGCHRCECVSTVM